MALINTEEVFDTFLIGGVLIFEIKLEGERIPGEDHIDMRISRRDGGRFWSQRGH